MLFQQYQIQRQKMSQKANKNENPLYYFITGYLKAINYKYNTSNQTDNFENLEV